MFQNSYLFIILRQLLFLIDQDAPLLFPCFHSIRLFVFMIGPSVKYLSSRYCGLGSAASVLFFQLKSVSFYSSHLISIWVDTFCMAGLFCQKRNFYHICSKVKKNSSRFPFVRLNLKHYLIEFI